MRKEEVFWASVWLLRWRTCWVACWDFCGRLGIFFAQDTLICSLWKPREEAAVYVGWECVAFVGCPFFLIVQGFLSWSLVFPSCLFLEAYRQLFTDCSNIWWDQQSGIPVSLVLDNSFLPVAPSFQVFYNFIYEKAYCNDRIRMEYRGKKNTKS